MSAFSAPEPVPLTVPSSLHPDEVLVQLSAAILEPRYSEPTGYPPRLYRLGGTTTSNAVVLTGTPCLKPGIRAGSGSLTLELRGEVRAVADRSELRGTVAAPVARRTIRTLGIVLVAFLALSVLGTGPDPFLVVFCLVIGGLTSIAWALILRNNQREALRHADAFAGFVGTVIAQHPNT